MEFVKDIDLEDVHDIVDAIAYRRGTYQESLEQALAIVLLNYGARFTRVRCVNGEWSGLKKEIPQTIGIPKCPNGHVLYELSVPGKLAIIKEP